MHKRMARLLLALAVLVLPAAAGTLSGTVRNGSTGLPATGQDVILIQLQGTMEGIATARTDVQGRYSFDRPELGAAPMLVRVVYKGVNYHQNVPPGCTSADIEIFEAGASEKDLQITSRMLIVQPNGPILLVGEEFSVHNHAKPPATFSREFEFRIPEGAELAQVAAWGPSAMPVVQGTVTKGKNHFSVPFPLKPGENGIRISYQMAYATNQAMVGAPSFYPADSVMVVSPPSMQIAGAGFNPAGTEQGWNVFSRSAVAAGVALNVAVAGTAPPPSETASSAGGSGAASSGMGGGEAQQGVRLQTLPGRIENLRWILLGGFAALFALGSVFLWRKPQQRQLATATAQVHREVHNSLDEIKDVLFRLELRRQAGTITDGEYAAERARIETTLRDLVKGRE